jgi:dTDP-4-dehydrorhamnose 3,5-epimerase-like enzyme
MESKLIDLPVFKDHRGSLVAIEGQRNIPFEIKRIYYILGTENNEPRGFHAHKNLQQLMVCLKGSCVLTLDNGKSKSKVLLNNPGQGIIVDKMVWREMSEFTKDCIILVLANDYYKEDDYIRNYQDFKYLLKMN